MVVEVEGEGEGRVVVEGEGEDEWGKEGQIPHWASVKMSFQINLEDNVPPQMINIIRVQVL